MALPIKQQLLPHGRSNCPTGKLILRWGGFVGVTVHGTGNHNAGTDAPNQANWQMGPDAAAHQVCVHGFVDDKQFIQTHEFDLIGWHAGDGCENTATDYGCWSTLGIEGCESSTVDQTRMRLNFAEVIARIHVGDPVFAWGDGHTRGKVSIDELFQHFVVSQEVPPHDCPAFLRHTNLWGQFMLDVDAAVATLQGTSVPPTPPGLPAGMNEKLARLLFGIRYDANGARYSFNLDGARSKRWIEHAAKTIPTGGTWIDGRWPMLEQIWVEGTGKGTKILQYSDGWLDDGVSPVV